MTTTPIITTQQTYLSGNVKFKITDVSCSGWRVWFQLLDAGCLSGWDLDMCYSEMVERIMNGDIVLLAD